MGLAAVEWSPGDDSLPRVVAAATVKTAKQRRAARVCDDDVRRMHILWQNIIQYLDEYKPDVVGVETYTVYKPSQGGHAGKGTGWKALYAYSMTAALGFERSIPVRPYSPTDLKRRVASNTGASKIEVERALQQRVVGLEDALASIPPSQHEHASDAIGHALLALSDQAQELQLV